MQIQAQGYIQVPTHPDTDTGTETPTDYRLPSSPVCRFQDRNAWAPDGGLDQ